MLTHPTINKLSTLKLTGMAKGLTEQLSMPQMAELSFEERLGLLVDREMTERENRQLHRRLKSAKLRHSACLEDLDFRGSRGLDKSLIASLSDCRWIREGHNLLITGPTGAGKTYLACAIGQKACREGFHVFYARVPRFLTELAIAKGDGRYPKLLATLAKKDLLVLDDWGLATLTDEQRRDLLEVMEDRDGGRSTLLVGQLPVAHWHEIIGDPTIADAFLDRLVHNAYRIELKGGSMRKRRSALTETDHLE